MAGSEKRQRTMQVKVRLTPDEFTQLAERSDKAGMTAGAYLRAAGLGTAGARAQRRLPVDAMLLRQVLGHLGRVGSNLNQIARRLNEGAAAGLLLPELREALADFGHMRAALYRALGKAPDEPSDAAGPPASKFIDPRP